jgi:tetratricopeptide (TPR) repeat protein
MTGQGGEAAALEQCEDAATLEIPQNAQLVSALLEKAGALRDSDRLGEAEAAYREFIALAPHIHDGPRGLGLVASRRGDHAAALSHFQAAQALAPDDVWLINDLANALRELGRLDEAEAAYRQLMVKAPDLFDGPRGLGLVFRQRGEHAAALSQFSIARALAPENTWVLKETANLLHELGHVDEAETAYRELVEKEPQFPEGHRGLGLLTSRRGEHAAALEHFNAAKAIAPENVWLINDTANELRELGRLDEAEDAYRKFMAKAPHIFDGPRGLGLVARKRGEHLAALGYFQTACALAPDNAWLINEAAGALCELGRLDEAGAIYRELVEKAPHLPDGTWGQGFVARQRGQYRAALGHFQTARALAPENIWLINDVANAFYELGRLTEAENAYRDVCEKAPHLLDGPRGLGLVSKQRGDHESALAHFQAASALAPDNVRLLQDITTELRELERQTEAEALLVSFIARRPDSAEALIAYANAVRYKTNSRDLILMFEKAAAIEPEDLAARLALAGEYLNSWRLDAAEAIYDTVLSEPGRSGWGMLGKGHVARRRGRRDEALKFFSEAKDTSLFEWATIETSRELMDAGRFEEAQASLELAILGVPEQLSWLLHKGYNARAIEDHRQAHTAFALAAAANPGREEAQVELAIEEFHLGQPNQAIERLMAVAGRHPGRIHAVATLANFAEQFDDYETSVKLLQRAVRLEPANLGLRLRLAEGLAKLGRSAEADLLLAACEAQTGVTPELCITSAGLLNGRGDYAAARQFLTKGAALFPTVFELWFQHVASLIASGAFDAARRAIDDAPVCSALEQTRVRLLHGEMAAAEWDLDKAFSHYVEGLKFNPNDAWLNNCAARVALLKADIEAAQRHLEASVRYSSSHRVLQQGSWKPSQTHIGQMLDEYRIDAEALGRLHRALAHPDPADALSQMLIAYPDYTPAAISLFIALRQTGRLASLDSIGRKGGSLIPVTIAQYWDVDIPADVKALCEGWRAAHPAFSYVRFSKADARRFLVAKGLLDALAAFDRAVEPAMQADIFRLAYLFCEGGYYIDADDRCIAPIPTLDPGDRDLILYQEDFGTVGNNFIGVRPRHPAIGSALESAVKAVNRGDADMVWLATGPALLTRSLAVYLSENLADRLPRTLIVERHELYRVAAVHTITAYKHSKKHWTRTTFNRARAHPLALITPLLARLSETKASQAES